MITMMMIDDRERALKCYKETDRCDCIEEKNYSVEILYAMVLS